MVYFVEPNSKSLRYCSDMRNACFILFAILSLFSCKKENVSQKGNPCGSTYGQTASLPSYLTSFEYKVGSYWVLRDSLNGNTDSIYVTNYDQGYSNDPCVRFQYYNFYTNSGSY